MRNRKFLKRHNYTAFGSALSDSGTFDNDYRYTSQAIDENDLYYMHARFYDNSIGRFLSTDPFPGYLSIPSTMHPYNYCGNNPVNFVDPMGLISWGTMADGTEGWIYDEDEGTTTTAKKDDDGRQLVFIFSIEDPSYEEADPDKLAATHPLNGLDPTENYNAENQGDPTGHKSNGNPDPPRRGTTEDLGTWVDTRNQNEVDAVWAKARKKTRTIVLHIAGPATNAAAFTIVVGAVYGGIIFDISDPAGIAVHPISGYGFGTLSFQITALDEVKPGVYTAIQGVIPPAFAVEIGINESGNAVLPLYMTYGGGFPPGPSGIYRYRIHTPYRPGILQNK